MNQNDRTLTERFPRVNLVTSGPENRCKTCLHWQKQPSDPKNLRAPAVGTCKLNPPQLFLVGLIPTPQGNVPQMTGACPGTGEDDFCGQHKPRITVEA